MGTRESMLGENETREVPVMALDNTHQFFGEELDLILAKDPRLEDVGNRSRHDRIKGLMDDLGGIFPGIG